MKNVRAWSLIGWPLLLAGCASISGHLPVATPPTPRGAFFAGAAKTDITPMPGYPMGGHSIAGRIARGYWTRLQARALYFEDRDGHAVALVSCDLWAIPAGLADRVAELVGRDPRGAHLGREQIALAATHTHQSPGNFSSNPYYNAFASPQSGFDRGLFRFLADRISTAILGAITNRQPAQLFYGETVLTKVLRNRSLPAFLLNPESREILARNQDLPTGPTSPLYPDPRAWRAVYPTVAALRAEKADEPGTIIGAAGFVAVHPTTMANDTEVYQSDFFGVAATRLEEDLRPSNPEAVVAIFNGAEGDVSAGWEAQDRRDTCRLGEQLHDCLKGLLTHGEPVEGAVDWRFARFTLADHEFTDTEGVNRRTARKGMPGAATMGGAEDGRSPLYVLGWQEGVRGPRRDRQGSKLPALDPLLVRLGGWFSPTRLAVTLFPPPKKIPLGVYTIGPLAIATLPGEFTTVMGRRIASRLEASLPTPPRHVLLVGPANEYLSYFATPEEYELQHYEGASTLYGPAAGPSVQQDLGTLAGRFRETNAPMSRRSYDYHTGPRATFGPKNLGDPPYHADDGLQSLLQSLDDGLPIRNFPRCEWEDAVPEFATGCRVTPRVRIITVDAGGHERVVDSDESVNIVTMLLEAGDSRTRWCAFWMPPAAVDRGGDYSFVITRLDGSEVRLPAGGPFRISDIGH